MAELSIERVILIVVDGMRPDGMLQAQTPAMRQLMARGVSTLTAQTVMPSITLPTHMSMFHSLPPEMHGVLTNEWRPMPGDPVPGILDLARAMGKRPAMFYTWAQLRDLCRPGALVFSAQVDIYDPADVDSEMEAPRLCVDYTLQYQPDLIFLYLGMVDEIGHRFGWMSPEYLLAIAKADQAIAYVLERMEWAGLLETSAVLLTSDHGGHEHTHGSNMPEDMTVPWILCGPGIPENQPIGQPVSVLDTAPTIAHLLGLPIPDAWQGKALF